MTTILIIVSIIVTLLVALAARFYYRDAKSKESKTKLSFNVERYLKQIYHDTKNL